MAVTEKGYIRPTFDDLLKHRIDQAKELFGDDIDTSNSSPLGKFIRLSVQDLAEAYEAQEIIYYSRFPHTAVGQNLDRLMPFAGITRNSATRAEHEIEFTGDASYEVPVGFLVGTTSGETFYLANNVVLDENGVGTGLVQCTELGEIGNVSDGEITQIINPDASVHKITHKGIVMIGKETETDAELRERFSVAIEGSGSGTLASIRGAVMRVNGVNSCIVIENDGDETDSDGRPPHSFEVLVYASETLDQQIAEAIFSKKPLGIKSFGKVSATVVDASGDQKEVKFSRVSEVPIYINVGVAVDASFEIDGVEQIQNILSDYINYSDNGEDVIYSSLYRYIFSVTGVKDVLSLSISTDGAAYSASNVIVASDKVARLSASNVKVEVTNYADK